MFNKRRGNNYITEYLVLWVGKGLTYKDASYTTDVTSTAIKEYAEASLEERARRLRCYKRATNKVNGVGIDEEDDGWIFRRETIPKLKFHTIKKIAPNLYQKGEKLVANVVWAQKKKSSFITGIISLGRGKFTRTSFKFSPTNGKFIESVCCVVKKNQDEIYEVIGHCSNGISNVPCVHCVGLYLYKSSNYRT